MEKYTPDSLGEKVSKETRVEQAPSFFASLCGVYKSKLRELVGSIVSYPHDLKERVDFEKSLEHNSNLETSLPQYIESLFEKSQIKPEIEYKHTQHSTEAWFNLDYFRKTIRQFPVSQRGEVTRILKKAIAERTIKKSESLGDGDEPMIKRFRSQANTGDVKLLEDTEVCYKKEANTEIERMRTSIVVSRNEKSLNLDCVLPSQTHFLTNFVAGLEHDGESSFFVGDNLKNKECAVVFGDLTKKGGFLSLFHEIIHAWQMKKYTNFPTNDSWNASLMYIVAEHMRSDDMIALEQQHLSESEYRLRLAKFNKIFECLVDNIKRDYGEHIGILEMNRSGRDIKLKLFGNKETNVPYEFFDLTEKRAKFERQAWAMAIKLLRHLKQHGFDLEPELNTHKDFEEIIYGRIERDEKSGEQYFLANSLQTYQEAWKAIAPNESVPSQYKRPFSKKKIDVPIKY